MKAIVWTKYGSADGLQLREVEKPAPRDNEVLIRIHATTVTAGDCELRSFRFPFWLWLPLRLLIGLSKPKRVTILGQEVAGEIEATGKGVSRFKVGEPILAWTGLHLSGYAEYTCLREDAMMAIKPSNMTYEQAAAVPVGGLEAWYFLRNAKVRSGEKVLIYGAGGSIGTFAIQLAKYFGAEVTGVDSAVKLEMLRSLGADHVIDYTHEDFTKNGKTYDVIIDVIGKSPFSGSIHSLTPDGRYLSNPHPLKGLQGRWLTRKGRRQVMLGTGGQEIENLHSLCDLLEAGKIKTVIDRSYPLEQAAEAHRYVDGGNKKGNVILLVTQAEER